MTSASVLSEFGNDSDMIEAKGFMESDARAPMDNRMSSPSSTVNRKNFPSPGRQSDAPLLHGRRAELVEQTEDDQRGETAPDDLGSFGEDRADADTLALCVLAALGHRTDDVVQHAHRAITSLTTRSTTSAPGRWPVASSPARPATSLTSAWI